MRLLDIEGEPVLEVGPSLRALRPTPVAVSACPDDAVPGWQPAPLCLEVGGDG